MCECLCTSAECSSVLPEVLDLSILSHQQTFQLPHLPLQQVAHDQQGAQQMSAHLEEKRSYKVQVFFHFLK